MTDHSMIFTRSMVRAFLEGRKTQTRRLLKPHNTLFNGRGWSKDAKAQSWDWENAWVDPGPSPAGNPGPYLKLPWLAGDDDPWEDTVHRIYPVIQPGDRIWIKEAHYAYGEWTTTDELTETGLPKRRFVRDWNWSVYFDPHSIRVLPNLRDGIPGWYARSPLFLHRQDSRLTLDVSEVRVQRLQDISEADARAEGLQGNASGPWGCEGLIEDFADLWNTIHGPDAWDRNDWILPYTVDPAKRNIDKRGRTA